MDHVILNEVNEMLQNDLQPIEQYDYITLDEMQPMEQDLVQYQDVEIQGSVIILYFKLNMLSNAIIIFPSLWFIYIHTRTHI